MTHDARNLHEAVYQIEQAALTVNEEFFKRKGFKDISDFRAQIGSLSAVIVLGIWQQAKNEIWKNPVASMPLTEDQMRFLERM